MITIIVIVFVLFCITGMPIAFALGLAGLAGILVGNFPPIQLAGKVVHAIDNFPLVAIPLFMLAGQLMIRGGVMERLVDFANAFVGRVRGGLGHVTVISAMGMSSVSGTAVADATALGGTLGPALSKAYGRPFGAALVASASNLGPIIPPSAGMILYAFLAEDVSIAALFLAGILPGVFLGLATMALCSYFAYRRNFPLSETPFNVQNLMIQTWRSFPVFMMPVVVLGGIIGGVFTATEGAAIAVAYALVLGFFITRKLRLSDIPPALLNSAIVTAIVGALIAFASQVTYLFTSEMVGVAIAEWLQSLTTNPQAFVLLVMVLLLLVGIPIEANASFIMLVPILAPIATQYGIDPVYFGLLFVFNITLGGITPPVGAQLFVVSGIWRVSMMEMLPDLLPFIILQYGVLFICMLFPQIVLFLPKLAGY
jgi:tripartite ATP-independent transporter DctM subunit